MPVLERRWTVMARIAMTGATGAVGGALLDAFLERGHTVITIGHRGAVHWDLRETLPRRVAEAFESVDVIVHAAADIGLAESYPDLYRVNVGAVQELVKAATAAPRPPRLVHVSSAFAQPRRGTGHNNGYEQSKWEAESVVLGSELDASILRPSLVIGSRADGAISRFSGIYIFIRMLRLGLVPAIPGFNEVGVDVIPVDAVAAQAVEEVERPSGRRILRITSGAAAPRLEELVATACDVFDARSQEKVDRPKFVTPEVYHRLFRPLIMSKLSPAQRVLLETVEIFLPYFEHDHVFESDLVFSRAELLETWKKSVDRWLDETNNNSTRGRAVWAKRN
jgi:nucleoside-diphosphate-sugar epimerase